MKIIKFDLPINGTKIRSLDELRDNFTTEILELHASGLLLRWINSRGVEIDSDKLSSILIDQGDVNRLVALCEMFEVDADRAVIEAALSKGQGSQGAALHADPEELKYKEKFEQLSRLMDELKSKKLYLTQDDYNRFVKDKIQIEQEGQVMSVTLCDETYDGRAKPLGWLAKDKYTFSSDKKTGDVVEAGEVIGEFNKFLDGSIGSSMLLMMAGSCKIKSPLRGILIEMSEITQQPSFYHEGDPICYIRVDHDTAPTIKIIPD